MTTTTSNLPQVFIDLMDDLSSDDRMKTSLWQRTCSLAATHSDYDTLLAECDGKKMVEKIFRQMERDYFMTVVKHMSPADREKAYSALGNSTYRSVKAVIKTATDFGVSLKDSNGKIKGKTSVEQEYRAKKYKFTEQSEDKISKAKQRLLEMRGLATHLVNTSSRERDTSIKILTELAVEVRGLDSHLSKLISNFQFEESN